MAIKNESKVKRLINKLEKEGYKLSDITDKSIKQLTNNKALEKFEKLVKRKLERKKIIEDNKKYDEKVKAKREQANEKIFKQFPWVKKVMKFDDKYKNIKDAKTVFERKLNEERLQAEKTLTKYFSKKNKQLKALLKDIKKETNINALIKFNDSIEFILEAYGVEENSNAYEFDEEDILERVYSRLMIEKINNK